MSDVLLTSPEETHALGQALAQVVMPGDAIALSGPLGAGKTSLARGLLAGLGLMEEAPSPSFAIIQPYDPPETRISVLHVDLYRIEDPSEAAELGLDEARLDALLVVEWAERLPATSWPETLWLTLRPQPDGTRRLTADVPPSWKGRWPLT